MSAIQQALLKAGVIEKEKLEKFTEEKEKAVVEFKKVTESLNSLHRYRRQLQGIREKVVKVFLLKGEDLKVLSNLIGTDAGKINLGSKLNQVMVLPFIDGEISSAQKKIKPLSVRSSKLKRVWGFHKWGK